MAKNDPGGAQPSSGGNPKGAPRQAAPGAREGAARASAAAKARMEMLERVLLRLESGMTLNKALAQEPSKPDAVGFLQFVRRNDGLHKQYADARLVGYLAMADDIVDICDEKDVVATYQGEEVVLDLSPTAIARNRLRTDNRKWLMSKCLPKIFGDRTVVATESGDALAAALKAIAERLPV